MKNICIFFLFILLINFLPAQDNTPPDAITDFSVDVTLHQYGYVQFEIHFYLSWTVPYDESEITEYAVYNYNDFFLGSTCDNCNSIGFPFGVANTNYCLTIKAIDEFGNISDASNEVCFNTNIYYLPGDVFLSQYFEGNNDNKAIELSSRYEYDYLSEVFDLSDYTLKINIDGGSTWSTPYQLSGTLQGQNSIVIVNSNTTDSALLNSANISTSNAIMQFDGNDAIGLFKNDVLIDIIGDFNSGGIYFAENVNLFRDPCENFSPSLTENTIAYYNPFHWTETYGNCQNDSTNLGLGFYAMCCLLSNNEFSLQKVNVYPNPFEKEIHISLKEEMETELMIFDILGKQVFTKTIQNSDTINLDTLQQGIYFLKISQGNSTVSKKLIKK